MFNKFVLAGIVTGVLTFGGSLARADLILSGDSVGIMIDEEQGPLRQTNFGTLTWNFHDAHEVVLVPSSINAQYDLTLFDLDTATISVTSQLICANPSGNRPLCRTTGLFLLTPSVPTRLTIEIEFDYRMSGDPTGTGATFAVSAGTDPPERLIRGGESRVSGFDPAQGTIADTQEALLIPGIAYGISYSFRSDATGDFPSPIPASGDGVFRATFTPIPEPATALLLGPAILALRMRRRR